MAEWPGKAWVVRPTEFKRIAEGTIVMNDSIEEEYVQQIESGGADQTSLHWLMALFCFVGIGVFFYFEGGRLNVDINSPDFNPLIIIPGALTFGGVLSLAKAAQGTLRSKRFGRVYFKMLGDSHIGGTLRGSMVTATELTPCGDWDIRLQLLETITYSSSKKARKTEDKVHLEFKQTIAPQGCSSRTGIPVNFQIPESSRKTINRLKGPYRWVLVVAAPFENSVDFSYSFGIRVHPRQHPRC